MTQTAKTLAVVTGASSGIGLELARHAAKDGHDLVIAADQPEIAAVASELQATGVQVAHVQADLATRKGVAKVVQAVGGRPVALLFLNAGHGLGRDFLGQSFADWNDVINTNIVGTLDLAQQLVAPMVAAKSGRVLFTGSIAGLMPGAFQAVYNGSKAFIDSFAVALRNEIKDSGVTVTVLMPGVTDTEFFERADMMDTKVGTGKKQDAHSVAESGYHAMLKGESEVVAGLKNKLQAAIAHVTPDTALAEMHRGMAEPGSAK